MRHVAVIDIGKTNAKVGVVDAVEGVEIDIATQPNVVLAGPPYPHFDLERLWSFVVDALAKHNGNYGIDAISIATHGASIALLDREGNLAAPMLDYEFAGPDELSSDYEAIRPDFQETGSPRLALGLNAGAQIYWQLHRDTGLMGRIASVVTYPQYWSFKLTGMRHTEMTSLGAHTDLWNPRQRCFSSLVHRLGIANKMAPARIAAKCTHGLNSEIAALTGLRAGIPVASGIHDSNASLYPYLLALKGAFSVVSTGTWVISFAVGGQKKDLSPERDTLLNVNAFGDPVPSARFMGGREFDLVMGDGVRQASEKDVSRVLAEQIQLYPAVDPLSGPFQGARAGWSVDESTLSDGERFAAASFYLALVTRQCLDLIGAEGPTIVEGPFARNNLFMKMLEVATARVAAGSKVSTTGTGLGAALLVSNTLKNPVEPPDKPADCNADPSYQAYARSWCHQVAMRQA
ncbi:FGGY-family carbohydrate kinase [uncultured Roseibium sp.]|uniref:FGGY-family carbohydrate kinase n=1 Tax=uncultured Roseibium sp. TaxID=1936171 RepID=UPI002617603B|nr:FGGY-family carbohydrate kinase [uncultured Roseibium sp.]